MSVSPSPPLRDEPLRRGPARPDERPEIALREHRDPRAVGRPPDLRHRRQIDTGPRVHEVVTAGARLDAVCPVALGQQREARAVDAHPREMHVIRVLARVHPHDAQPHLPRLLVHALDPAHHPLARGDRVLHPPRAKIDQVQVIPARPLRHPDQLVRLVEAVREDLVRPVDESLARLLHDHARRPSLSIDEHVPHRLMPATVVEIHEPRRVGKPLHTRHAPRILDGRFVHGDALTARRVEQPRPRHLHIVPPACGSRSSQAPAAARSPATNPPRARSAPCQVSSASPRSGTSPATTRPAPRTRRPPRRPRSARAPRPPLRRAATPGDHGK